MTTKFTKRQLQVLYHFYQNAQNTGLVVKGIDSVTFSRRSGLWEVWYLDYAGLLNYKLTRDMIEWR